MFRCAVALWKSWICKYSIRFQLIKFKLLSETLKNRKWKILAWYPNKMWLYHRQNPKCSHWRWANFQMQKAIWPYHHKWLCTKMSSILTTTTTRSLRTTPETLINQFYATNHHYHTLLHSTHDQSICSKKFQVSLHYKRIGLTQDWYILPHWFKDKPCLTTKITPKSLTLFQALLILALKTSRYFTIQIKHATKLTKLVLLF